MPYATREEMVERWGMDALLVVADRDQDGVLDDAVVDKALVDASAEIDSYVGVLNRLPLPELPAALVQPCCDIAMYRLSPDGTSSTEEKRKRYEDAVKYLVRVSEGKASLGLATPPDQESSGFAFFESEPKRFGKLL
ncbi:gp436 family protein [Pseudomonas citronellolis]|uniref:gp436 family protein n=1 Tax=Pseudomonas citronellolis TaxID=53408 RepID=UPI002D78B0D4|nr:phage protein Gp36 family protein [Pseudomonas citronellolis]WRT82947.1 phage protein Gp36 family protein [Pseudomonas citronellolis]